MMKKDLYRNRMEKALEESISAYLSSINDDLWIFEEDIIGTQAHNIMLYEMGHLKKEEIEKILTSLEKLRKNLKDNSVKVDSNYEDIHPFIEQHVIDEIGMETGGKLHTGRSRNDQVSVDIRMKIRKELNNLSKNILSFNEVLLSLSEDHKNTLMPLYTHLQRAQVGTFSHYLNNYLSQMIRSLFRIEELYQRINLNPLGSCAIGGTSIKIDRERTSALLGFEGIITNSIDAVSSRDYIYETLSILSLISLQFSRIAEDLILWCSKEFDLVEIDDQYCSVSSVMPQKKNPDTLELTRSKVSKIVSNTQTASLIIKAIPTGYFRDFQDLKPLLKESFQLLNSIISVMKGVFSSIIIHSDKGLALIDDSFILALDLAELLVQKYDIPFRQSHKVIGRIVKNTKNPSQLFDKTLLESTIFEFTKKKMTLSEEDLEEIKNPYKCLEKRISTGSPSLKEIESLLTDLNHKNSELFELLLLRKSKIQKAADLRTSIVRELQKN